MFSAFKDRLRSTNIGGNTGKNVVTEDMPKEVWDWLYEKGRKTSFFIISQIPGELLIGTGDGKKMRDLVDVAHEQAYVIGHREFIEGEIEQLELHLHKVVIKYRKSLGRR